MLYDQAQLLSTYANIYKITQDKYYEDIMRDIIRYVERDLQHHEGGFYSAEDADSLPHANASKKLGKYREFLNILNMYSTAICYLVDDDL
jgi:uncharacterized protein YyaL (SSP411 family)